MCLGEIGTIVSLDTDEARASVRVGNRERDASVLLRPEVRVGDEVVLHTGFVVDVLATDEDPGPSGPGSVVER